MATCKYAVVGTGLMGLGIATVFARFGHDIMVYDSDPGRLDEVTGRVDAILTELADTGRFDAAKAPEVHGRFRKTSTLPELAGAGLILEAVPERLELKRGLYRDLEEVLTDDAIIASNTSGFLPDALAAEMRHPERLLIAHFYNPPHFVPLVEIVPGSRTRREHLILVRDLMNAMEMEGVVLDRAVPGFVGNRIQFAILREALHIVQTGVATPEVVDLVIRSVFGRRYPMIGQLEVADMGGLDTFLDISRHLMPDLCKDESVLDLLEEYVKRGETGLRTGKGFYVWDDARKARLAERRAHQLRTALKP